MLVRYFSIFQKYSVTFWVLFSFTCLLMFGFAFYQSTTVLHLTNKFKLSIDASYQINGVFSAVAYLSCIISGYITQKYINSHTGLLIGFIFYICACLLTSVLSFNIFLLGLSFFSLGYGFIYTNTFFLLGKLYHLDDERREGGFTIAYMGLNLGSLAGYMFSGFAVKYNMYSLTTIILGFFFIVIVLLMWALNKGKARLLFTMRKSLLLYMTVAVFSIWVIFLFSMQLKNIISLACIILLLSVFLFSLRELKKNRIVARNLFILGILTLVSVVYWTIYKMQDSLFLIFFVHHVNRDVLGFTIPAPSLLSINPIVILLFGPILSLFWIKTGKRFNQPTHKVFFGVAIFAVAFIPVIIALKTQLRISIGSVVLFVAIISFSELALGPGTISMVGQLAQEKYQMFLLGLVQLSTSLASIFSAQLSVMLHDDFLTAQYPLSIGYEKVFFILSIILVVSAMFVLLLRKVVRYEA